MIRIALLGALSLAASLGAAVVSLAQPKPVSFHVSCVMHGGGTSESARLPFTDVITCGKESVLLQVTR